MLQVTVVLGLVVGWCWTSLYKKVCLMSTKPYQVLYQIKCNHLRNITASHTLLYMSPMAVIPRRFESLDLPIWEVAAELVQASDAAGACCRVSDVAGACCRASDAAGACCRESDMAGTCCRVSDVAGACCRAAGACCRVSDAAGAC